MVKRFGLQKGKEFLDR